MNPNPARHSVYSCLSFHLQWSESFPALGRKLNPHCDCDGFCRFYSPGQPIKRRLFRCRGKTSCQKLCDHATQLAVRYQVSKQRFSRNGPFPITSECAFNGGFLFGRKFLFHTANVEGMDPGAVYQCEK